MTRSYHKTLKNRGYTSTDEHYRKEKRKSDRKSFRKSSRDVFANNDITTIVNKLDESQPSKPERHVRCPFCHKICQQQYKEFDLKDENGALIYVNEEILQQKQKLKNQSKEVKLIQHCNTKPNHKKKKIIKKIERNGGLNEISSKELDLIIQKDNKETQTEIISEINDYDIEDDETDSETESHLRKLKKEKLKKNFYSWSFSAEEVERYETIQNPKVFKFYRKIKNK